MDSMLTGVLVVAGAAALALLLRGGSRGDEQVGPMPGAEGPDEPAWDEPEAREAAAAHGAADVVGGGGEVAVVSSDGWTFVPFGGGVRLWPPAAGCATTDAEAGDRGGSPCRPAVTLSAGDLIAARVVPGTPGEAPWCVETLGRDREFSAWSFETEEAAGAAREMLERWVLRVPAGPDGEPEPVADAEFDEARHVAAETLRELATMPETEPPEEPGG